MVDTRYDASKKTQNKVFYTPRGTSLLKQKRLSRIEKALKIFLTN